MTTTKEDFEEWLRRMYGGSYSVGAHPYSAAEAMAWLAWQHQQSRIDALEAENAALKVKAVRLETSWHAESAQVCELEARLKEAEKNNFALAAGQCIVSGGLCGDAHGNQYCSMQKDAKRYQIMIASSPNEEICFCGETYFGKQALDAAIDAMAKTAIEQGKDKP
jgi:hypothetical protein